ncbi:matrixin family metalloprotease [uncultured Modestobacter sp.]|uniref:matrixin family metalloprotease n=1 Tax=uncultured Modestobacter sp. TaxID=380048 RepID=UPI002625B8F7|nr:matrixin family metalloprotease [uncultured Modestobacter sp.]
MVAVLTGAWLLGLLPGVDTTGTRRTVPSPGVEASDGPLGTPLTPTAGGTFAFAQLQDDGVAPVAYDPCRPVHYAVRPDNAPYGGDQLIADAVAQISAVTGLRFVADGPTDEAADEQRAPFQPDRYGDRWAPVLVTWSTVAEQPDFVADVAGQAGSLAVSLGDGPDVYVTGAVELDAAQFADILSRPGGQAVARAIVLHEFAHLVGLDHVDDPTQLMYPTTSDVLGFAAGDLTGLSRLGSGACVPAL